MEERKKRRLWLMNEETWKKEEIERRFKEHEEEMERFEKENVRETIFKIE